MDIDYMKFSSVMYDTLTRFQISEFLNPPILYGELDGGGGPEFGIQ